MVQSHQNSDELLRLSELARYNIVMDEKEDAFCELARLAMLITGTPLGGVSLVDHDHVWLKGREGIDLTCLARKGAFCSYAIESNQDMFEIPDTLSDPRFEQNPLVSNAPHIRYYTAANLTTHRGYRLGTLWVMDTKPRDLTPQQCDALQGLASQVVRILELRYQNPLTQLPNRNGFIGHLQAALKQIDDDLHAINNHQHHPATTSTRHSIIGCIHIHNLPLINSAFGHDVGDQLIQQLAERLKLWLGPQNILGHLDDEHFAFALLQQDSANIDALHRLLSHPIPCGKSLLQVTSNIGLSHYPDFGQNAASLLDQAATAASRNVNNSESLIQEFASPTTSKTYQKLAFQRTMQEHLREKRLIAYYQPQIDLHNGQIIGFEALARIRHPEQGIIYPQDFISQAEEYGLIHEVDLAMFERICQDIICWQNYQPLPQIAANLSRNTLMHPTLPETLSAILERYNIAPSQIEIEVTESGFVTAPEAVGERVAELRQLGFKISIDDFGTGFSNLGSLRSIHFDRLKADRQYVHGASTNVHIGGILRFIKGIADVFGVELVCEGLEDEADLAWVAAQGCHHIQGWYFCKALPPENIPPMLDKLEKFYASGRYQTHGPAALAACLQNSA